MLAERGVGVDHATLYRWVQRYAPELEKRVRRYQSNRSSSWRVDSASKVPKTTDIGEKGALSCFSSIKAAYPEKCYREISRLTVGGHELSGRSQANVDSSPVFTVYEADLTGTRKLRVKFFKHTNMLNHQHIRTFYLEHREGSIAVHFGRKSFYTSYKLKGNNEIE